MLFKQFLCLLYWIIRHKLKLFSQLVPLLDQTALCRRKVDRKTAQIFAVLGYVIAAGK